jgi:DinB superfamily
MDTHTRQTLVAQYKDGYRVVAEALAGATEAELDRSPAPGKWTPRQIVHHLADSEMTAAIRLRLLVATDQPRILGYDQDEFAKRLHYRERSVEASMDAFGGARATTGEILDHLTDAEWARTGTHSEIGHYSVELWLEIYGVHAHNHAAQIRAARALGTHKTA